ncbi:hypothetical protein RsoM2USA_100 [Ralstonia phage RsoM2USA]|nr:hypothetical protein RsoM2USA_100 [Ralstonia phage RsoM2USA]
MSVVAKIKQDWMAARKARNAHASGYLSTLLTAIEKVGMDAKEGRRETTEDEALSVIKKFKEGVEDMLKYTSNDELTAELMAYTSYLPEVLSDDQLRADVVAIIESVGKSPKAIGEVQKQLKAKYGPQGYDAAKATALVKELIS